eukprot:488526-Pleurochrysis_carterae.AAC.1
MWLRAASKSAMLRAVRRSTVLRAASKSAIASRESKAQGKKPKKRVNLKQQCALEFSARCVTS